MNPFTTMSCPSRARPTLHKDLLAAMLRLPEPMRNVLRLRGMRGLSNDAAARWLELSEDAVRELHGRAMARLTLLLARTAGSEPSGQTVILCA